MTPTMCEKMNNIKAQIIFRLLSVKGVGTVKVHKIFASLKNLYSKPDEDQMIKTIKESLNDELFEIFQSDKRSFSGEDERIGFITLFDDEYPDSLKSLGDHAPLVLSYIGNADLLNKNSVGFCGSRKASEKGISVTRDCAEQLVRKGFVLVSGYAAGVDFTTHRTALENRGETIVVIAEGINNFRIKSELKQLWDWNKILVISEFLPGSAWSVSNAMQRNGTIVALSNAMILIESSANGGSMDAGKKALEMKKPLYAPFYEGMPESAVGNRILIEKGAIKLGRKKETGRANMSKIIAAQTPADLTVEAVCEQKVQTGLFEIFETNGKE